jgi:hypothetical protein
MKRRHTYAAVLAAGLLTALGSASVLAEPATTTTTESPPAPLSISPSSGRPGQAVTLTLNSICTHGLEFSTTVLTIGIMHDRSPIQQTLASATVNSDAKPGTYDVSVVCNYAHQTTQPHLFAGRFTVVKNPTPAGHQVKQVPVGAAQTGDGGAAPQSQP